MSSPAATAAFTGKIAACAFTHVATMGLSTLGVLFQSPGLIGARPTDETWHEMLRLPEPSGSARLIVPTDCSLRLLARTRRPVSTERLSANPRADIRGVVLVAHCRIRHFQLNLEAGVAESSQERAIAALLDDRKYVELAIGAVLPASASARGHSGCCASHIDERGGCKPLVRGAMPPLHFNYLSRDAPAHAR